MIKTPVRARARAIAILVPFLCVLGVGGACTEELRSNGQSCLKDGDCLSGVCANFVCIAGPPLLDAEVNGDGNLDASTAGETGGDATPDTMPGMDAAKETAPPMEAATEASTDAAGDGGGDASRD